MADDVRLGLGEDLQIKPAPFLRLGHFSVDAVPEDLLEPCLPILLRRINPICELGRGEKLLYYRSSPEASLLDRVCSWV